MTIKSKTTCAWKTEFIASLDEVHPRTLRALHTLVKNTCEETPKTIFFLPNCGRKTFNELRNWADSL